MRKLNLATLCIAGNQAAHHKCQKTALSKSAHDRCKTASHRCNRYVLKFGAYSYDQTWKIKQSPRVTKNLYKRKTTEPNILKLKILIVR